MLIDFRVTNYRSIKSQVTLSMAAAPRTPGAARQGSGKRRVPTDEEIAPTYRVEGRDLALLPVAGLYGENAAGKTNILRALDTLLVRMWFGGPFRSSARELQPFRLDPATAGRPTEFEIRIAADRGIFTYRLVADQERVHLEELSLLPPTEKQSQPLFRREWSRRKDSSDWSHGPLFEGPHLQLQDAVADGATYLSVLFGLRNSPLGSLRDWLMMRIPGLSLGYEIAGRWDPTIHDALDFGPVVARSDWNDIARWVTRWTRRFDVGISDIEVREAFGDDGSPVRRQVVAWHDTPHGRVAWDFAEESSGTHRMYAVFHKMINALLQGNLLLIDELSASLHPNLARKIVKLFQDVETNPKRAQLVFTSHDNTLQRGHLLRRDQIWFATKDGGLSTNLYPLTQYKLRNDAAIDRAYLDGRFRAVPVLPEQEDLRLDALEKA